MTLVTSRLAMLALVVQLAGHTAVAAAAESCDLPASFVTSETELAHVIAGIKARHGLDIAVVGSGSSSLPGPEGASVSYPARLEQALKDALPNTEIKVTTHVQARQTAAEMATGLEKILADEKPSLVIWQTGTADAIKGVEPEDFRTGLEDGLEAIEKASADVILMNMQYSPRTESMLDVSAYADDMRWEAQQRGALLFDRLGLMRYWNEAGTFDLYAATKNYDMARRVHGCIGRALASLIINASHLDAAKVQTTR
jgi:hypothetical protein